MNPWMQFCIIKSHILHSPKRKSHPPSKCLIRDVKRQSGSIILCLTVNAANAHIHGKQLQLELKS